MEKNAALLRKKIAASGKLKEVMRNYFLELNDAAKDRSRKVAWCTSVGPAELLRSLGYYVYFPENHGALLGATRTATDCIPHANAQGYSPDICSYLTSDIGAFIQGFTPLTKIYPEIKEVPRPDVLVYNTNQCRDVQDWFTYYAKKFLVPLIGINSPRAVDFVTGTHIRSVARQMESLVHPLEEIAGKKLDIDMLRHVVSLSQRTSELWKAVLNTAAHQPSPFTFFDGTIHMGPAVVLRGTEVANEYYEILLKELREREAENVAAVEGERYRLYWEGMPIWGKLRELSELFSNLSACVVASTYCNSWIFDQFDPSYPYSSMAKAYTELFIVRSDEAKETYIEEMVKSFGIHGIIFHESKTCPNNSNSRYGMPKRLKERIKVPTLIIDGDLNDLRLFSEEQTKTKIEAFVEQLAEAHGG